jgi:hypothetical protein
MSPATIAQFGSTQAALQTSSPWLTWLRKTTWLMTAMLVSTQTSFWVHKKNGAIRKFQQSKRGPCHLDTATQENHTVLAIAAVEANKSKHTERDCSRAQLARKIQNLICRLELKDFTRYFDGNSLPNCPMQRQDAINADAMFGRDIESLKGKITRQQLQAVLSAVANNLPKEIMEHCCNIMLCVDIVFVNPVPFFVSISKRIRFVTAKATGNS